MDSGFREVEENGRKDDVSGQAVGKESDSGRSKDKNKDGNRVFAPISGEAVSLTQVNDETFSAGILGEGIAILPSDGRVLAPFDGEVVSIFDTKHAIGLKSDGGVELLIHVGLETVQLNGKYFIAHVKDGQRIRKGERMLEFDPEAIRAEGYSPMK